MQAKPFAEQIHKLKERLNKYEEYYNPVLVQRNRLDFKTELDNQDFKQSEPIQNGNNNNIEASKNKEEPKKSKNFKKEIDTNSIYKMLEERKKQKQIHQVSSCKNSQDSKDLFLSNHRIQKNAFNYPNNKENEINIKTENTTKELLNQNNIIRARPSSNFNHIKEINSKKIINSLLKENVKIFPELLIQDPLKNDIKIKSNILMQDTANKNEKFSVFSKQEEKFSNFSKTKEVD